MRPRPLAARRVVRFMRKFLVILVAVLPLLFASPATAEKPSRFPLVAEGFTATDVCAFPVRLDLLLNNQSVIEFADGRTTITGHFVSRLTNLNDPSKTLVVEASGPIFILPNPDGTFTLKATGQNIIFFFPGDLGPGEPGGIFLIRGLTLEQFDADFNFVVGSFTHQGDMQDLCAVLA